MTLVICDVIWHAVVQDHSDCKKEQHVALDYWMVLVVYMHTQN